MRVEETCTSTQFMTRHYSCNRIIWANCESETAGIAPHRMPRTHDITCFTTRVRSAFLTKRWTGSASNRRPLDVSDDRPLCRHSIWVSTRNTKLCETGGSPAGLCHYVTTVASSAVVCRASLVRNHSLNADC